MATLKGKYFIKKNKDDEWEDITTKFLGVKILSISDLRELGEAVNVYNEQWINSQREDFMVTTKDEDGNDVVVRKNLDLKMTFICGTRYGASSTQGMHDIFVDYMTKHGDFYIKTLYDEKEVRVVCLKGYKPTTKKLHRGFNDSYILGTIELHALDSPTSA